MPCSDVHDSCPSAEAEANLHYCKKKLNLVTRVACDLRTILRRSGKESDLTEESKSWIAEHDEWDRKRVEQETANGIREETKRRALKKLNLDERRALGL